MSSPDSAVGEFSESVGETRSPVSVPSKAPVRGRHGSPATAVFARRVEAGREPEYERLAEEMVEASEAFPGHLAATMLHEPSSRDYTLVYSFVDQPALEAWLDSGERQRLLTRADQIAEHHDQLPVLTGLETWFTLPHRATIRPPAALEDVARLTRRRLSARGLLPGLAGTGTQRLVASASVGGLSAGPVDDDDLRRHADRHPADAAVARSLAREGLAPFEDVPATDDALVHERVASDELLGTRTRCEHRHRALVLHVGEGPDLSSRPRR